MTKKQNRIPTILGITALIGGIGLLFNYSKQISRKLKHFLHARVSPLKGKTRSLVHNMRKRGELLKEQVRTQTAKTGGFRSKRHKNTTPAGTRKRTTSSHETKKK